MAKTREKKTPTDNGKAPPFAVAVNYGNVNVGDRTVRLAVGVSRGNLTVTQADRLFCGRRLTVSILARAGEGGSDQDSLPGLEAQDLTLDGIADTTGFGARVKTITFGLTFAVESVSVPTLARFAKRAGIVTVTNVADIPEGEGKDDDAEE